MKGFDSTPYLKSLEKLCQEWKVQELYIFDSATTEKFNSNRDLDFLVVFQDGIVYDLKF